ncbi:MAG: hypothetical protein R3A10_06315 [Caldilineaceae bacterium]
MNTIRPSTDPVSQSSAQTHPQDRTHAGVGADAPDANARRNLQAASLSLGLASPGLLLPPVQFAAIPTLIYMGIPAAQEAYATLRHDRCAGLPWAKRSPWPVALPVGSI